MSEQKSNSGHGRGEDQQTDEVSSVLDVAIVGAGPAGLVSAKTLLSHKFTNFAVFDETISVGGIWNCEERPLVDCVAHDSAVDTQREDDGSIKIQASSQPIYPGMRTNFPGDLASFLQFPFPQTPDLFPDPQTVHKYYQDFAKNHLSTRVDRCVKINSLWNIETTTTTTTKATTQTVSPQQSTEQQNTSSVAVTKRSFKAKRLLVCNGHFRKAFCPNIPGLSHFKGTLLHSPAFGPVSDFANQTVLIVGGYISGSDIAKMLMRHGTCPRIIVSVRNLGDPHMLLLKKAQKQHGVVIRPAIKHISSDGRVHFDAPSQGHVDKYSNEETNTEAPDVIIFATGYRYYFPFLPAPPPPPTSGDNGVKATKHFLSDPEGFKMTRLYKRILFVDDTSLAFIGITNRNLTPPISLEYQAQWFAQCVMTNDGKSLPDKTVMEKEALDREQNDPTQDVLMLKFPSYCNLLVADLKGVRGFWTQIMLDRLPMVMKSMIFRDPSVLWWAAGAIGVAAGAGIALRR